MSEVITENIANSEIKKELLSLLKIFHNICLENDIKYSLHGGTLLGAIRHKGFIPWDDDLDVTLSREEYNKLVETMKNYKLPEDISFEISSIDAMSRFISRKKDAPHAWIDILIYDFITENKLLQKIKIYLIAFLHGMLKEDGSMRVTKEKNYSKLKYYLYYIAYLVGRIVPVETTKKIFTWTSRKFLTGSKKLVHRSNDQYIGLILVLPKRVIEKYTIVQFEDSDFMASDCYEEVLISSYGKDYMTPVRYGETQEFMHNFTRDSI